MRGSIGTPPECQLTTEGLGASVMIIDSWMQRQEKVERKPV